MKKYLSSIIILLFALSCFPSPSFAEQAPDVLYYCSFDKKLDLLINNGANLGEDVKTSVLDGGNQVKQLTAAGKNVVVYVDSPQAAVPDRFVTELKLKILSFTSGNGNIQLFNSKKSQTTNGSGIWRMGPQITPDGYILVAGNKLPSGTLNSSLKQIAVGENTEFVRLSAAFDLTNGTVTVFCDGAQLGAAQKTWGLQYAKHGFFEISVPDGCEIYIDDVAIYEGTQPLSDAQLALTEERDSIMDSPKDAQRYLGSASAFSVYGNYYYHNGSRLAYQDGQKPIEHDGEAYVTESFVSGILSKTQTASVNIDGKMYIPAEKLAETMGKSYYYDDRGFFIFSDEPFAYTENDPLLETFEPSDYIYRYLQFENPSGEKMMQDFQNGGLYGQHPRILITSEELAYVKNRAASGDTFMQQSMENDLWKAQYMLEERGLDYYDTGRTDDSKKQVLALIFQTHIQRLAQGYLFSDDADFRAQCAEYAIHYMKELCTWESLAFKLSNLTIGHWAMGMAIGYDVFYNELSDADKAEIKSAVLRLAVADTELGYIGGGYAYFGVRWVNESDNFSGVSGGGMMALALAFADEPEFAEHAPYLLENLIKTNYISTSLYYPDGGYFESPSYSEYMLTNLVIGLEALTKICGTDYGAGSVKGFSEAGSFFPYMQGKTNCLNFHDGGKKVFFTYLPSWFAYRYGTVESAQTHITQYGYNPDVNGILERYPTLGVMYQRMAEEKYGEAKTENAPLDRYFYGAEAGSFRSGFDTATPTFAAFHGGRTRIDHDSLDLGQFVFESDGVPWAVDLGGDDYGLANYFDEAGYKIYRKKTEGENCLVINPAVDADTYYGQKLNTSSETLFFESDDGNAMAAYDLTDAYSRDVSSYQRGYYFGDDRSSFTIQDEFTLKEPSEVYSFMHTAASIQIINNNRAVLTQNGKTLNVYVYCSEGEFELKEMEAKPLPTSPAVSGQNENKGYRKLAVHIPDASSDVRIVMKLVPQSAPESANGLQVIPLDYWTVPGGKVHHNQSALFNVDVDENGLLDVLFALADDVTSARLLVDGEMVYSEKTTVSGTKMISGIDLSKFGNGEHELKLEADRSGGITTDTLRFTNTTEENPAYIKAQSVYQNAYESLFQNDLTTWDGTANLQASPNQWFMSILNGTPATAGDCLTISMTNDQKPTLYYKTNDSGSAIKNDIFTCEFDVKFQTTDGTLAVEQKNSNSKFFWSYWTGGKLFEKGKMADGTSYEVGQWYHVKTEVDFSSRICAAYINGNQVIRYDTSADANQRYADDVIQFGLEYSPGGSETIYYKNFSAYTKKELSFVGHGVSAQLCGADDLIASADDLKLFACMYDESGRALQISVVSPEEGKLLSAFSLPDGTKYTRIFAFHDMMPACADAYVTFLE